MATKKNICAACGYPHLLSPQRSASGGASHEICPACGFEPGYTDDDQDITPDQWRDQWVAGGKKWFSKGTQQPTDWKPAASSAKKTASKKAARKSSTTAKKAVKKRPKSK